MAAQCSNWGKFTCPFWGVYDRHLQASLVRHWFKHIGERYVEGCRLAKVVTPGAKRDAVAHLCKEHEVSQRRACSVLGVDLSSVRYQSVRPDDAELRKAMKAVAAGSAIGGCMCCLEGRAGK